MITLSPSIISVDMTVEARIPGADSVALTHPFLAFIAFPFGVRPGHRRAKTMTSSSPTNDIEAD